MSDKNKKRMAGDALADRYGGEKEYGSWGSTWDNEAEQQQLKASGKYDAESDYAKQFSGMKENISSRVDDEDGWRQLSIDGDLKDPTKYADLVNKWSGAGFDVRAIDMGKGFHSSNIAVRIANGDGTGIDNPVNIPDDGGGSGGGGGDNDGSGGDSPITIPGFPVTGGERVSSMIQNVNQDNDITNTISGDNNTVTNTQDNSVSQSSGYSDYAPRLARSLKDGYLSKLLNR